MKSPISATTPAQYGAAILEQPGQFAWQVFDSKVFDLLYAEYRFHDAHFIEADTLEGLIPQMTGVDHGAAAATLAAYNDAVDEQTAFDPTILDGKAANDLTPPKSNWAQKIDTGPFRAYPVTGGITFTYGGLKVDAEGSVITQDGSRIPGLFACGEIVGGVFFAGYPADQVLRRALCLVAGRGMEPLGPAPPKLCEVTMPASAPKWVS